MKKLTLLLSLCILPLQASFSKKVARTLTNGLFYLIASSDASQETATKAQDILTQLTPAKDLLAVRKFNRFGKFLFGEHNTITIPYLNYVIVDDDNMQSLSEEAQTFALGRCMMTLRHQNKYLVYKYLFPFLGRQAFNYLCPKDEQENIHYWDKLINLHSSNKALILANREQEAEAIRNLKEDAITFLGAAKDMCIVGAKQLGAQSLSSYLARSMEYQLDALTVQELNCKEGALEYLAKVEALRFPKYLLTLSLLNFARKAKEIVHETPDDRLAIQALTACYKATGYCIKAIKYLPGQQASYYKTGIDYLLRFLPDSIRSKMPGLLVGIHPHATRRIKALDPQLDEATDKQ